MASKRKAEPVKKTVKSNKKKTVESFDADLSDDNNDENVAGSVNGAAGLPKLSEELLATRERAPGHLVIAGVMTWDIVGQKPTDVKAGVKIRPNLWSFNRYTDEKYRLIRSGCASAHSVLVNMDRKAMTFGRNKFAQLGQPQLKTYEKPKLVPGLEGFNIIDAACGRKHTLFLTDAGVVYSCGDNKSGQCGVGKSTAMITKVTRLNYNGPPIIKVGCGAEFSVIQDVKGNLHTFGLPEYGQLGHNTEGKYFITSSRLSFHFELSPKRIPLFIEKASDGNMVPVYDVQIVDFACGNNHTVAIDSKKRVFSWGFGGVGRLGHGEQKDDMVPRLIKYFEWTKSDVRRVFCGSSFSLAISGQGQLYLFGQKTQRGEANMNPKPVHDLAGWNITDIGCGYTSTVISADDSVIAWGASPTFGELGLGDLVKSSSRPKEVSKMSEMKIPQIAMGYSHTLMLVDTDDEKTKSKYGQLNEFVID